MEKKSLIWSLLFTFIFPISTYAEGLVQNGSASVKVTNLSSFARNIHVTLLPEYTSLQKPFGEGKQIQYQCVQQSFSDMTHTAMFKTYRCGKGWVKDPKAEPKLDLGPYVGFISPETWSFTDVGSNAYKETSGFNVYKCCHRKDKGEESVRVLITYNKDHKKDIMNDRNICRAFRCPISNNTAYREKSPSSNYTINILFTKPLLALSNSPPPMVAIQQEGEKEKKCEQLEALCGHVI